MLFPSSYFIAGHQQGARGKEQGVWGTGQGARGIEQGAKSREHGARRLEQRAINCQHWYCLPYLFFKLRIKPVIILHSCSKSSSNSSRVSLLIRPRLSKTMTMFAFSDVERLAILRNCANSFFDKEPEPSATLFEMLRLAPRICSANLYSFFASS